MMTRLQELSINNNGFTSSLPFELNDCTALKHMNIFINSFTSTIPPLGKLTSLEVFAADKNSLVGVIPPSFELLTGLTYLSIIANSLTGSLPDTLFGSLTKLRYISFWLNYLTGSLPLNIGSLAHIQTLDLRSNSLTGSIPESITKLTTMRDLRLRTNSLEGPLPSFFGALQSLTFLDLYTNKLSDALPSSLGLLTNLHYVFLHDNAFIGSLPSALGNLKNLRILTAYQNKFTGSVPSEFGLLRNLESLLLHENDLSKIPDELSQLSNLQTLMLGSNRIAGTIASNFSELHQLQVLSLHDNKFSSTVPRELISLTALVELNIFGNSLTNEGPFPEFVFSPNLQKLSLGSNSLTCTLPQLLNNSLLKSLDLSNNPWAGTISPFYGQLSNLQTLNISHCSLSGSMPISLCELSNLLSLDLNMAFQNASSVMSHDISCLGSILGLQVLSLDGNAIHGPLPLSFSNLTSLTSLSLTSNHLTSTVPGDFFSRMSNELMHLSVAHNSFSGTLPYSILGALGLTYLDCSFNNFSLGDYSNHPLSIQDIAHLDISFNPRILLEKFFLEFIVENFDDLRTLILSGVHITGTLPSFGPLTALTSLQISSCQINSRLSNLPSSLVTLNMSNNLLWGPLPLLDLAPLPLQKIDFSRNNFSGPFPTNLTTHNHRFGQCRFCSSLELLDLSHNSLDGNLTDQFTYLYGLVKVDMSHNRFIGHVPSSLGLNAQFKNLQEIFFESNFLTGTVPAVLANLPLIETIDLSYNYLGGAVPTEFLDITLDLSGNSFQGLLPAALCSPNYDYLALNLTNNDGILCYSCTPQPGITLDIAVGICTSAPTPAPQASVVTFQATQTIVGCNGQAFDENCKSTITETVVEVFENFDPLLVVEVREMTGTPVQSKGDTPEVLVAYLVSSYSHAYSYEYLSDILIKSSQDPPGTFARFLTDNADANKASCLVGAGTSLITTQQIFSTTTVVSISNETSAQTKAVFAMFAILLVFVFYYFFRRWQKDKIWNEEATNEEKTKKTHCYISHLADRLHDLDNYVDDTHDKVVKIVEALRKRKIKVAEHSWQRPENVHINVWYDEKRAKKTDKMKRLSRFKTGIDNTTVVIPVITKNYAERLEGKDRKQLVQESQTLLEQIERKLYCGMLHTKRNVVQEEFFHSKSKQFVPIILDKRMKSQKDWSGWLAKGINDLLFISLWEEKNWLIPPSTPEGRGTLTLKQQEGMENEEMEGEWIGDEFHSTSGEIIKEKSLKDGDYFLSLESIEAAKAKRAKEEEKLAADEIKERALEIEKEQKRISAIREATKQAEAENIEASSAASDTATPQEQEPTLPADVVYKKREWLNKNFEETIDKLAHQIQLVFSSEQHTDVFLAHAWGKDEGCHKNAIRVNEFLKKQTRVEDGIAPLETWLDEEKMTKEVKKSMRNGLEKTQVALVFITREYETRVNQGKDNNAQFEFYHIAEDFKSCNAIIPIVCEVAMKNQSKWRGYLQTLKDLPKIDFSDAWEDEMNFTRKCTDLLVLIRITLQRLDDDGGRILANRKAQEADEAARRVVEEVGNFVDEESAVELTTNPLHQSQRPSFTSRPFFGQTSAAGGGGGSPLGIGDVIPKKD